MQLAIDIDGDQLREFCRRWKVTEFALFGSAVRPEAFRPDSDVDVLVSFADDAGWSLLDHVRMRDELCEIFGREVDLLTRKAVERSLNRFRRESILTTAVLLDVENVTGEQIAAYATLVDKWTNDSTYLTSQLGARETN